MGASGSGKSTLLGLAGGLDKATTGAVLVDGSDLAALPERALAALRRRTLGFVFQDFNLLPGLTAAENAAAPLELDGVPRRDARDSALAAMSALGVDELADRYPGQMSGGQQQRVAIARATVGSRRLILADEPTGALDRLSGELVLQALRGLCDRGAACLLVSHNEAHAKYADRVVRLADGSVESDTAVR
jgi:putative ABC transport system ATP-binding protein